MTQLLQSPHSLVVSTKVMVRLFHPARGFTLIELLVAIGIFAVLAVIAYGGLNTMLSLSHHATLQAIRLIRIESAVNTLSQDLAQVVDRPIRDEYGDAQPSFIARNTRTDRGMEFTRGGRRNPGGFSRASLQRIGYVLQEDRLLRLSWQVLDRAEDSVPVSQAIVDGLDGFGFRFLDNNGAWHDDWPPTNTAPMGTTSSTTSVPQANGVMKFGIPRAVEVVLEFRNLGRITRLYPLY